MYKQLSIIIIVVYLTKNHILRSYYLELTISVVYPINSSYNSKNMNNIVY